MPPEKPIGNWVPVSQSMPEDEITCLVWSSHLGGSALAFHYTPVLELRGDSGWIALGSTRVLLGVTHYCQDILPPLPH
jgi:hypothetical protein